MKNVKFLALGACALLITGGLASCGKEEMETVKVGFQPNFGASAGMTAVNEGYFEEAGVKVEYSNASGPNVAAAVLSGSLDVGFLGNGVAWNYFTENSTMKLIALDNLTDDDRLIARKEGKGGNLTLQSSEADLVAALKGSKVGLEIAATPGSFWNNLLNKLNSNLADGQKIWYMGSDGTKLPAGLAETNYIDTNKVEIFDVSNANVTAGMNSGAYDFCVAFAPVATTLEKDTAKYVTVAKTSTHMSESYTPSTWAVNTNFLKNHETAFKKFMIGLVKGMTKRQNDPSAAATATEVCTAGAVSANKIATDIAVWLGAEKQLELCEKADGKGYAYAENIRNSALKGGNADKVKKTVAEAVDFSYVVEAAKKVK